MILITMCYMTDNMLYIKTWHILYNDRCTYKINSKKNRTVLVNSVLGYKTLISREDL